MFRDAYANANRFHDPYAMYRQPPTPASPPSNDPYSILRQFMSQAQDSDLYAPRTGALEPSANDHFSAARDTMNRHSPPTSRQQYPFSSPSYEEPPQEERHPLGPPGKTKEGYDCFIGYDHECYPLKPSQPRSGAHRRIPYTAEAYEPHLNADGTRNGVLEPSNPDCDPEYDPDCRLRRHESPPAQPEIQPEHHAEDEYNQGAGEGEQLEQEPYQSGQEEPLMSYQSHTPRMPSLQDILRLYGDRYPGQADHRAYAGDYRKK